MGYPREKILTHYPDGVLRKHCRKKVLEVSEYRAAEIHHCHYNKPHYQRACVKFRDGVNSVSLYCRSDYVQQRCAQHYRQHGNDKAAVLSYIGKYALESSLEILRLLTGHHSGRTSPAGTSARSAGSEINYGSLFFSQPAKPSLSSGNCRCRGTHRRSS